MNHELAVRSHSTVWETSWIEMTCTCGWKKAVAEPDENADEYDDGVIALAALNAIAAGHLGLVR